jgi:hypothetical protein
MRLAILVACAACTSPPADVMGTYSGQITKGANGCMLENWTDGAVVDGVTLAVTQDGAAIAIDMGGGEANELELVLSNHTGQGQVSDTALTANIVGFRQITNGTCTLRLDGLVIADVSGTKLDGEFHFRQTVLDPGCVFVNDAGVISMGNPACDSVTTMHVER